MTTLLGSGGVSFGSGGVRFAASDSYAAYPVTPTGPPTGFTGPVAPGYVTAGDPRLIDFVEDSHASVIYTGAWAPDYSASYHNGDTRYTDTAAARATFTYYGGGFSFWAQRYNGFGTGKIYVDGVYVADVSEYDAGVISADRVPITLIGGSVVLVLPLSEGLHTVAFEKNAGRFLFDAIELATKP